MSERIRKSKDKIFFGVCGGFAEYFDIDPTLVRLVAALLFCSGTGLFLYLLAAIIMPSAEK